MEIFGSRVRRKKKVTTDSETLCLDKVFGLTVTNGATLVCDPYTNMIAYPAGCVVVLFNHRRMEQYHIINKKTITALAFSSDGKYMLTGESGFKPAVRVWNVEEKIQVAEFFGHKFGVKCVAFSPNSKYIVSVGMFHDMVIDVWNWKNNVKVASNKISFRVSSLDFAEDGSYFVTVGKRNVKFWYLTNTKLRINETVPLKGRAGLLRNFKDNFFTDVSCGKGLKAGCTYCITSTGMLCEFDQDRRLHKWVNLSVKNASGLAVGRDLIFVGCAEGFIRVFDLDLNFVISLPRPHCLGVDVADVVDVRQVISSQSSDVKYPDAVALTHDDVNKNLSCVYSDRSLYIWDVHDVIRPGKVWSSLFHAGSIWGLEVYPNLNGVKGALPPGTFITCSSDDTTRIWNPDHHLSQTGKRNIYSHELLKTLYIDPTLSNICDPDISRSPGPEISDGYKDGKNGIRSVRVSPDGKELATGDRLGNIRIYDLATMKLKGMIEAHDAEVLSLEYVYSKEGGNKFLASASRDRLIHIFLASDDHPLMQTLDDHSSSITAVKFTNKDDKLCMLSCSADKSLLFRIAELNPEVTFTLHQHLVGKTTLYDMDVDPQEKFVATVGQDRTIRIYNIKSAKLKKTYKGSVGEDGVLIKVSIDPSGSFLATSCTNKHLAIFDFYSGDLMATMAGHSEIATGIKFLNDRQIISVSGDGCIFVWHLPVALTRQIQLRTKDKDEGLSEVSLIGQSSSLSSSYKAKNANQADSYLEITSLPVVNDSDMKEDGSSVVSLTSELTDDMDYKFSIGRLPKWAKVKTEAGIISAASPAESEDGSAPRGRWAQRMDHQLLPFEAASTPQQTCTNEKSSDWQQQQTPVDKKFSKGEDDDDECFRPPLNRSQLTSSTTTLTKGPLSFEDEVDSDSDVSEVIYLPSQLESPGTQAKSFPVYAANSKTARDTSLNTGTKPNTPDGGPDADSEAVEDGEDEEPVDEMNVGTPTETEVDLWKSPEQKFVKENYESLSFTSVTSESFQKSLDLVEHQAAMENPGNDALNPRFSISRRFLSKAQQANAGVYSNIQRQDNWFDYLQKRKDIMARAVNDTKKSMQALGWQQDSAVAPIEDATPEKDSNKLKLLTSAKAELSEADKFKDPQSPLRQPQSPLYTKERDPFAKLSSRERCGGGQASSKDSVKSFGKQGGSQSLQTGHVRRSWSTQDLSKASPSNQSVLHTGGGGLQSQSKRSSSSLIKYGKNSAPRKMTPSRIPSRSLSPCQQKSSDASCSSKRGKVSLMELRIDEQGENKSKDLSSGQSQKSGKPRNSIGNRKSRSERNLMAVMTDTVKLTEPPRVNQDRHAYWQQTESSLAKVAKGTVSLPQNKEKKPVFLPAATTLSVRLVKQRAGRSNKAHLLSSKLSSCMSVPNLATIKDEEEPESNLKGLSEFSLSVPNVNKLDETSESSNSVSSDGCSTNTSDSLEIHSRLDSREMSSKLKRRATTGGVDSDGSKEINRTSRVLSASTSITHAKGNPSKCTARHMRRSIPELSIEQAKDILRTPSSTLERSLSATLTRKKTAVKDVLATHLTSESSDKLSSMFTSKSVKESQHSKEPVLKLNGSSTEKHQSPAVTSKAISAALKKMTLKYSKPSLAALDVSPNDPPERDCPSRLHLISGPSATVTASSQGLVSASSLNTDPDSKWTSRMVVHQSSFSSNSSSSSLDINHEPALNVRSKVALFDSQGSSSQPARLVPKPTECYQQSRSSSASPCLPSNSLPPTLSDTDNEEEEVKRPDKSRSRSPVSLIVSDQSIKNSVALTTPMTSPLESLTPTKTERGNFFLPVHSPSSVTEHLSADDNLECSKKLVKELNSNVRKLISLYHKVSQQSDQQSREIANMLDRAVQENHQTFAGLAARTPSPTQPGECLPEESSDILPAVRCKIKENKAMNTQVTLMPSLVDDTAGRLLLVMEPMLQEYTQRFCKKVYEHFGKQAVGAVPSGDDK